MWRKQGDIPPSSSGVDSGVSPAAERISAPGEPRPEPTCISKTITVKGEIFGRDDIFIDGEVQGSIRLPNASVTVGPHGRVSAEIEAHDVVIHGSVKGNVRGCDRAHIGRSGAVTGNVTTRRILIEEGAFFKGSVEVVRSEEQGAPRSTGIAVGAEALRAVPLEAKERLQ